MTCVTVREPFLWDVILFDEFCPELCLLRRRNPAEVKNFILRANELFWLTVTTQAIAHGKGARFPGEGHLLDFTMTAGATDPFVDVDAVVKVDKFRKTMDSF